LIKLPDTSKMKVIIKVHESHVNNVTVGQPAFVVLDSAPEKRFVAYVDKVALLPDNQSRFGNPNLKVYNTDIVITESMLDVKPGVSARAEIIITNIADSISVPIQAVSTRNGKLVCFVRKGATDEPVPVEIGLFNTRFIQILSGLQEGDQVLLSPPFEQRDLEGAVLEEEEITAITNTAPRPVASAAARQRSPDAEAGGRGEVSGMTGTGRGEASGIPGGAEGGFPGAPGDAQGFTGQAGGGGPGGQGFGAPGSGGPGGMNPEQMRARFEEMRRQFDKDGDGELNEEEQAAMRADMQQRFGGMMGGGRNRQGTPGEGFGGQGRGGQRGGAPSGESEGGTRPSRPSE
jgi:hypothetical protein